MSLISSSNSPQIGFHRRKPISLNAKSSPFSVSFPLHTSVLRVNYDTRTGSERFWAVRSSEDASGYESDLLRKPSVSTADGEEANEDGDGDGETWVDWEDKILEDTVPLVGFVRMILHSGTYESGDRLSPEHEKLIIERLLAHHPEHEKKIGCGINYITIGYHPNFESSRCLFIVRKDGEFVDFSYWKCLKGLIRKKYPLYADSFILRHLRKRRSND